MNPYIKAAQEERKRLLKQIGELQEQVADLDAFLRIADRLPDPVRRGAKLTFKPRLYRKQKTGKAMIIALAEEMLTDGKRIPTRTILEQAQARGIEIKAKNKLLRISSILSRAKEKFESDRSTGWALRAEQ